MNSNQIANLLMVANYLATVNADDFLPMQGPFQEGKACAQDSETGQWYLAWLTVDGRARVDYHGDLSNLVLYEVEWDKNVKNRFIPVRKITNRQFDYS